MFFQQVSISGHINGKGVVADWFPRGRARLSPSTVRRRTFTDRQTTTSASAPRSPSSRRSPTSTLSGGSEPRVARVYCDRYDTETGELLDADPRQNLKRVAHEVEEELGYSFPA